MTECMNAEVRDALPDLLHGRLGDLDRATMKAHVESCADCRAELALMERVRAYAPLGPSIDVSRIVSMLPAPVPSAEQQVAQIAPGRQHSGMSKIWKLAAAVALIVAGTLTFSKSREPVSSGSTVAKIATVVHAPSAASEVPAPAVTPEAQPKEVAITNPVAVATSKRVVSTSGLSLTGGVQDLTDTQLEALLREVDNVEGLPTAEPETISVVVDGDEGLQ